MFQLAISNLWTRTDPQAKKEESVDPPSKIIEDEDNSMDEDKRKVILSASSAISIEHLKMYLPNRGRSGGGPIDSIEQTAGDHNFLVVFEKKEGKWMPTIQYKTNSYHVNS